MMLSVPSSAAWRVRATGASIKQEPVLAKSLARDLVREIGDVLKSTIACCFAFASRPSFANEICFTIAPEGNDKNIVSAFWRTSPIDFDGLTPEGSNLTKGSGFIS